MLGEIGIAMPRRAILQKAQRPAMHMLQIGIAALREGAQQIERRRRLAVRHQHALRVWRARGFGELGGVDDVAAIARQRLAVQLLGPRGARLGELPGDAAKLHHRHAAGESQHHRHLQEHAEEVANIVGAMLGEALGAIAALQQEGLALRNLRQLRLQTARLACKNQRRKGLKLSLNVRKLAQIRIDRGLLDRLVPPGFWTPTHAHLETLLKAHGYISFS